MNDTIFNFKFPKLALFGKQEDVSPKSESAKSLKNERKQLTELKNWIDTLPIANIPSAAKQVYRMLKRINRTAMDAKVRFQFIELLLNPLEKILYGLEKYLLNTVLPLPDLNQQMLAINVDLVEELIIAYKIIIHDLTNKNKLKHIERNLLETSLFYGVYHLSNLLYTTALLYQPPPSDVWRELHKLFLFADNNEYTSQKFKVRLGQKNEDIVSSLRDIYIGTLLFATANTTKLHSHEIQALYQVVPEWSNIVQLQLLQNAKSAKTHFIVNLDNDQPPKRGNLKEKYILFNALQLNTKPLVKILKDYRDNIAAQPVTKKSLKFLPPQMLSQAMLNNLIQAWDIVPHRNFTRTRLNLDLSLIIGFDAIFATLKPQDNLDAAQASTDEPVDEQVLLDEQLSDEQIWLSIAQHTSIDQQTPSNQEIFTNTTDTKLPTNIKDKKFENIFSLSLEPSNHDDDISFSTEYSSDSQTILDESQIVVTQDTVSPHITLSTVNESIGGFCVEWQRQNAPSIKVGELVGIVIPLLPNNISLASIRWIYDIPKKSFQVGLQLLISNAEAINLLFYENLENTLVPIPKLIPAFKSTKEPCSLITSLSTSRLNKNNFFIKDAEIERHIELKLIDNNGAYAFFNFKYTD